MLQISLKTIFEKYGKYVLMKSSRFLALLLKRRTGASLAEASGDQSGCDRYSRRATRGTAARYTDAS